VLRRANGEKGPGATSGLRMPRPPLRKPSISSASLELTAIWRTLTRRAQIERDMGRHEAALRDQEEALAIYRELTDQSALPHVIRHLADILQDAGRHEEAAPYYREMLVLQFAGQRPTAGNCKCRAQRCTARRIHGATPRKRGRYGSTSGNVMRLWTNCFID
jgi:tetratricopeptide (TPR) repeat protein